VTAGLVHTPAPRTLARLHLNIVQFPGSSSALRMAPPLTMTAAELDEGLSILDAAIAAVG